MKILLPPKWKQQQEHTTQTKIQMKSPMGVPSS